MVLALLGVSVLHPRVDLALPAVLEAAREVLVLHPRVVLALPAVLEAATEALEHQRVALVLQEALELAKGREQAVVSEQEVE